MSHDLIVCFLHYYNILNTQYAVYWPIITCCTRHFHKTKKFFQLQTWVEDLKKVYQMLVLYQARNTFTIYGNDIKWRTLIYNRDIDHDEAENIKETRLQLLKNAYYNIYTYMHML